MKLRLDVRRLLATCTARAGVPAIAEPASDTDVDLRRLPWDEGSFAAIELDDVPDPDAWTVSGPALNECRRVLKRSGLLEMRTRRKDAKSAQASDKAVMASLARLLQNHGFEVVSMDSLEDGGSTISALALRSDGPEDVFDDAMRTPATHLTLHGPYFDGGAESSANRALAISLDEMGVRVRVRVIFDVVDALAFD